MGIHPSIASHRLNIFLSSRPVRQKVRRFHSDRQKIIQDEVDKLLEAGFIREVEYSEWLENVVVVPKKKGKWRVCVDYTNLNNACPKDSFPLLRINQRNGQAETTNKTLVTAVKKRLEQAKRKWVEELPDVLWAYRTTPGWSTGNTPFALAYGMDAVNPTETGLPTIRTEAGR